MQLGEKMVARVYRWEAGETVRHRSAVREYTRAEPHTVTVVHKAPKAEVRTSDGVAVADPLLVIVPWCRAFRLGDRLGDEESASYEVVALRQFPEGQHLEVVPC